MSHVVSVELANGLYPNIEFLGLGGSNALSKLFYVTFEGFYGDREVLGCVGGGEA